MKNRILLLWAYFAFTFSNAQELKLLIEKALENNPKIKKFELRSQRALEQINEAKTIPNTEFAVGYFVSEPETRTGAQVFKVSAKQMLPWFGTITSRKNYISSLADTKFQDIVIAKRKLIMSVSQSYYNLYANKAKQKVLTKNSQLLKTYKTLVLTLVEVGKASVVDVLKLQIRQNEIKRLKEELQQQFLAEQTLLKNLLNAKDIESIVVVDKLEIPSEEFEIATKNLALHPELIHFDKLYQSVEQSELLNKKESSPMVGFGIDYISVDERPDMSFADNGKDILMPKVSVSIPIFNSKHASKSKQNELEQQEIKALKQERLNFLETRLSKAVNQRKSARINYVTQTKNLHQTKAAEEILMKSYETGTVTFLEVLDLQELQLKFNLAKIESIRNYYLQTSIINYLIK